MGLCSSGIQYANKTTWTSLNSSYQQCNSADIQTLCSEIQLVLKMLPIQAIHKVSTYHKGSNSECLQSVDSQGEMRLKSKYYSSPKNISYLPSDMGKNDTLTKHYIFCIL